MLLSFAWLEMKCEINAGQSNVDKKRGKKEQQNRDQSYNQHMANT